MQIFNIETLNFKCDGGTMFGVVPKFMWNRKYKCDDNNMCDCSVRSIIIAEGDRKILVDTGIGNKFEPEAFEALHVFGEDELVNSIEKAGIKPEEITDVIFTHLHYDHAGGAVKWNENKELEIVFPNATHWVSKAQFDNHQNSNVREADAYYNDDIIPLMKAGKLKFCEDNQEIMPGVEVRLFNGHTPGLVVPFIECEDKTVVFAGDLIPTAANLNVKWIASYDIEPLKALEEKAAFLKEAAENDYKLIFQHDIYTQACSLKNTERGAKIDETFYVEDLNK